MKTVLILCHDFPPLNTVAGQRPYHWSKALPEYGLKTVVITYYWPENIAEQTEKHSIHNEHSDIRIEDQKEVHRIQRNDTKRNQLIAKHGLERKKVRRKMLSFKDHLSSHFSLINDEHASLYSYTEKYISENKVDMLIVTGGPFILFKYGYLLNIKYHIPWIADYRDEWTNNHGRQIHEFVARALHPFYSYFQAKWTRNCRFFTTVSLPLKERLQKKINKKGYVIRNGVDADILPENPKTLAPCFTLFYAGTIYDCHYLNILEQGLSLFLKEGISEGSFKLVTVGIYLNETKGSNRFATFAKKYPAFIELIGTMKQEEVLKMESQSTAMLNLVPTSLANGIFTVKLYEYLMLEKVVLNIESHHRKEKHDFSKYVIDCPDAQSFHENLKALYKKWEEGQELANPVPDNVKKELTRQFQTKKLSELLISEISSIS